MGRRTTKHEGKGHTSTKGMRGLNDIRHIYAIDVEHQHKSLNGETSLEVLFADPNAVNLAGGRELERDFASQERVRRSNMINEQGRTHGASTPEHGSRA